MYVRFFYTTEGSSSSIDILGILFRLCHTSPCFICSRISTPFQTLIVQRFKRLSWFWFLPETIQVICNIMIRDQYLPRSVQTFHEWRFWKAIIYKQKVPFPHLWMLLIEHNLILFLRFLMVWRMKITSFVPSFLLLSYFVLPYSRPYLQLFSTFKSWKKKLTPW